MAKILSLLLLSFLLIDAAHSQDQSRIQELYSKGLQANQTGDYSTALENFIHLDSLYSNNRPILSNLAIAQTGIGFIDSAVKNLEKLLYIDADTSVLDHSVFDAFRNRDWYQSILNKFIETNRYVSNSDTAFVLDERDLHPEDVAFDPETRSFLVSSIRKQKIVRIDENKQVSDFFEGLPYAGSGMAVDSSLRILWICSPATRESVNYEEIQQGRSALLAVNLDTGELLYQYNSPADSQHFWGDVLVLPAGGVLVTDSINPSIFHLEEPGAELRLFRQLDELRSIQGITLNPQTNTVFFSDYSFGLFKFSMADTLPVKKIDVDVETKVKAIDGLTYYRGSLIATQNGVSPKRITRFELNGDQSGITRETYLEKANPALDEPTLGFIADNTFYYVANSPWTKYDENGQLMIDEVNNPLINKLELDN